MFLRFARKNVRPLSAMSDLTEEQSERCNKTGEKHPGSGLDLELRG